MHSTTTHDEKDRVNRHDSHNGCRGVTLVELLVAATILVVAIVALLALVRTMQREQNADYHRRQARLIINRIFESSFNVNNFPGPYVLSDSLIAPENSGSSSTRAREIKVTVDKNANKNPKYTYGTGDNGLPKVVLDNRYDKRFTRQPLNGDISAEFLYATDSVKLGTLKKSVESHLLTLKVKWTELGETQSDSVVLTKRLAKAVQQ